MRQYHYLFAANIVLFSMVIKICKACKLLTGFDDETKIVLAETPHECALCFGLLSDDVLRRRIAEEAARVYTNDGFDGSTFLLAVNVPVCMHLRQIVIDKLFDDKKAIHRGTHPKNVFGDLVLRDIEKVRVLQSLFCPIVKLIAM